MKKTTIYSIMHDIMVAVKGGDFGRKDLIKLQELLAAEFPVSLDPAEAEDPPTDGIPVKGGAQSAAGIMYIWEPIAERNVTIPMGMYLEARDLIEGGHKLKALKYLRDECPSIRSMNLKEGKQIVDQIQYLIADRKGI